MKTRQHPFLISLFLFSLLCAAAVYLSPAAHMQQSSAEATVQTNGGLHVVRFDTPMGRITVNLPDDTMAGDTISGTVVAELKGQTQEEQVKNQRLLNGLALEIDGKAPEYFQVTESTVPLFAFWRYRAGTRVFMGAPPQTAAPTLITVRILLANEGKDLGQIAIPIWSAAGPAWSEMERSGPFIDPKTTAPTHPSGAVITPDPKITTPPGMKPSSGAITPDPKTVPTHPSGAVITPDPKITPSFIIPPLGQTGRPIEITGPFDGNSSNTTLNWAPLAGRGPYKNPENETPIPLLAESPRKAVFESPTNVIGPIEITLMERNTQTTGNYRNVGVNLSAPKTNLLKGERTTLTVQVTGLEGIRSPVPLTLDSKGVITMEGAMFQPLMIQPSQVGADGRYTTTRGITGVQNGGWTSTATVVTQPFNIVLRDPSPPQTILVNSFTGDYVFCGSGPKLTGTGQIKRQGCIIQLTDNRPDRQVQGTLNTCVPVDNGRLFTFYSAGTITEIKVTVTDTQPPKQRIYFNPLGKPAPPIQDTSAFATCP